MLKGNLAPNGCVIKPAAADPRFLKHRGKAIAFEDYNHMMREIERDDLDVTPDHILVLKNAGPKGGPGMPEWGMLPIPKQLVGAGRARHDPHFRRPHERHQLRRLHPARRAGKLRRRAAGASSRPATRSRSTSTSARSICTSATRNLPAARPPGSSRRRKYPRGYGAMFSEHIGQADRAAISISCRARRRFPSRKFTEKSCKGVVMAALVPAISLR